MITYEEVKSGSYKNPENQEKAKRNGCFTLCILEKRGQVSIVTNTLQLINLEIFDKNLKLIIKNKEHIIYEFS